MKNFGDYSEYSRFFSSGAAHVFAKLNHHLLDRKIDSTTANEKILEIGPGASPHFLYRNMNGVEAYWMSDFSTVLTPQKFKTSFDLYYHYIDKDPLYKKLLDSDLRFTRIIASQSLEHIPKPEHAFLSWVSLMSPDSQIDISLPCDPGLLWRLCQICSRSKVKKIYGFSAHEYDLIMAREHINSAHNLMRIINYYAPSASVIHFPTLLPSINSNLIISISIRYHDIDFDRVEKNKNLLDAF